ncbi:LysR family transcriptional regulator [Streptomyces sp. NPDC005438]|uniref:LysR family transcriptional regulator n=1 Tax=Streptomyces sp. NPDC005438 TaxID=3156880 RepID=UPI0033A9DAF8
MNDRMLRAFVTCARTGSLTRTARELGYSPASISEQIRQLERLTHKSLFHRSHEGMMLTAAGEDMVRVASEILRLIDELKHRGPLEELRRRPEPVRVA